jgi:hypothetical protein
MATYEVPVWFKITAATKDEAFWKIRREMLAVEEYDQLPDYVVEEPVELATGQQGWIITTAI